MIQQIPIKMAKPKPQMISLSLYDKTCMWYYSFVIIFFYIDISYASKFYENDSS